MHFTPAFFGSCHVARARLSRPALRASPQNSSSLEDQMATKSVPHFATQSRTILSGSEKAPLAQVGGEQPAPSAARMTVSVIVRRKTPLSAAHSRGERRLT